MSGYITAYEVIRIINSRPLFIASHFDRFDSTVKALSKDSVISYEDFLSEVHKIIKSDKIINGNIRIDAKVFTDSGEIELQSMQIPHHYPSKEDYKNGVKVSTLKYERQNPGEKIWDEKLREKVDQLIKNNNVYEVIYVNNKNIITEGSRSNIFFIKEGNLFSAPLVDVLPGITRKYIIETAEKIGIPFDEKEISVKDISLYDSAFISGTSPKILPVNLIDNIKFDVEDKYLRQLMNDFDTVINSDIKDFVQ